MLGWRRIWIAGRGGECWKGWEWIGAYHHPDVVPNLSIIAVRNSDVAYELQAKSVSVYFRRGTRRDTHFRQKGVDDLGGERFCELEEQDDGELAPRERSLWLWLFEGMRVVRS